MTPEKTGNDTPDVDVSGPRGTVAVCLAFRNAARYLREWLLFHRAAGVDFFFLYDNDSEDDFAPVLRPWLEAGIAELITWPGYYQQTTIYDDCLARARGRFTWVAFIDDDEFLFDTEGAPLVAALQPFAEHAALAVPWYLFGSAGKTKRDEDFVIRRFQRRWPAADQHHKCIVRPERVVRATIGGHLFESIPGFAMVGQQFEVITSPTVPRPQEGRLRLHHYLTKSIEELTERRHARDIGTGDRMKLTLEQWIELDRGWNEIEDSAALALIPRMEAIAAQMAPPAPP